MGDLTFFFAMVGLITVCAGGPLLLFYLVLRWAMPKDRTWFKNLKEYEWPGYFLCQACLALMATAEELQEASDDELIERYCEQDALETPSWVLLSAINDLRRLLKD